MADNYDFTPGTGKTARAVEKSSKLTGVTTLDIGGAGAESLLTAGSAADAASIPVTQSTEDKAVQTAIAAVEGTTAGAAVITDANGTIQQYLRGLVKLLITTGTIVLGAGTAAIGKLAANSGVDIGDVDVLSIAAGTNLLGKMSVAQDTASIYNGATALTPKRALVNVAASQTDSAVVTAVADKKIRVVAMYAVAGGTATNLTFNTKPAGAGTAITPLIANGANGGEILPFNPAGWFETVAGEGLSATTGAGSTTGIQVIYIEV